MVDKKAECPECGLENTSETIRCYCGYIFSTGLNPQKDYKSRKDLMNKIENGTKALKGIKIWLIIFVLFFVIYTILNVVYFVDYLGLKINLKGVKQQTENLFSPGKR